MSARILPREEWHRLDAEAVALFETMNPEDVAVVVVEEGDAIVARLGVLRVPHLESLWVAPQKVGNAGVARALIRCAGEKAAEWSPNWAAAYADRDDIRALLVRLGGRYVPVDTYVIPLRREEEEWQQELG